MIGIPLEGEVTDRAYQKSIILWGDRVPECQNLTPSAKISRTLVIHYYNVRQFFKKRGQPPQGKAVLDASFKNLKIR